MLLLCLAMAVAPSLALGHHAGHEQRLPTIGPAPDFSLTSQDGATVALRGFAGRSLAVAFIYTSCPDVCPLLTEKMAQVQDELGPDFGSKVAFVSITVDPEHDTPPALKAYAEGHGANLEGLELPHRCAAGGRRGGASGTAWRCRVPRMGRWTTHC